MKLNRFILIFLAVLMIVPTASVTANYEPVTAPPPASQDVPEPDLTAQASVSFVLQGVKVSNINQLLFAKRARRYIGSLWYFYSNGVVLVRCPNIIDAVGRWRRSGNKIIVAAQRKGYTTISFVDARIGVKNLVAGVTDVGSGSLGAEAVAFTLRFRRVY